MSTRNVQKLRINLRCLPRLNFMQIQETASFTIKSWQLTVTNGLATNHTLVCVVMRQWNQWQLVVVTVIVVMGMGSLLMALKVQQGLWTSQRQELSTLHVTQILRKNQKQTSNLLLFSVRVTMLSMTKFWLRITTNGFLTLVMTMFATMPILRL